ncbi:MAG: trypsin-like peptidase domain-containing protein, partial [Planctomycetales bacterium]|nr:trypsin-like peptidase domain-containing protein [Planctomycetales bacterium]
VHSSGGIATAYHVMNKSTAVARAVMLADGRAFPVVEVLAADMAHDVALIRVDATDLPASPIAVGDGAGTPVTVIAHPGGCFYNLTQGHISRYFGVTRYGRSAVQMAVTAEFADGSSGGAIFNDRGELTGIVSATNQIGNQMVYRTAAPAFLLRRLTNEPTEPSGTP